MDELQPSVEPLLTSDGTTYHYVPLAQLGERVRSLPFSVKVLLEAALRQVNGREITSEHVRQILDWGERSSEQEIPFKPARVILQDFTGVPAVVDLASMRDAMLRLGGDPAKINPSIPVDLVIDHSVQVDAYGNDLALFINMEREFERNRERYEFLRWGQQAFQNFNVVPPASGIVHQVNLEYLSRGVLVSDQAGRKLVYPDSLVGTDSHTTMINGLGVLGWGVGGIEAEAVMLGQPIYMLLPEVVGVKLTGRLPAGATATDLALAVTERLRAHKVVGKFVEFFGPGLDGVSLPDRATIANMAPEYGATTGFFPMDAEAMRYLMQTGRSQQEVSLIEAYARAQGLFRTERTPDPRFSEVLTIDLGEVEVSLAGPKRPQDRVPLRRMQPVFREALTAPIERRGFGLNAEQLERRAELRNAKGSFSLAHGAVVIAAITSCTNTSNPSVMVAAGLVAKRAVERGLKVPGYVKTSLAPGSKVVTAYLKRAGLDRYLDQLGFQTVGYGCTTCIGNSGPLDPEVVEAIQGAGLVAASVLSGNRNFEGRINPYVRANYLASPPLVVIYALTGTVDIDLAEQPVGIAADGSEVHFSELWPSEREVAEILADAIQPEMFQSVYHDLERSNPAWNALPVAGGTIYPWQPDSTYIQNPPFFSGLGLEAAPPSEIRGARVLVKVGDSVTTDHISPAGSIARNSPAGWYLEERGVQPADFNSYGARRGNDLVMTRGTFANVRLKNELTPGVEGGVTVHLPSGEQTSIFEASQRYLQEGTPLIVLAGKDYGMGSSRDWAAKGTALLGIRAVIAESFERIHRSNLALMGVLPLEFQEGQSAASLGLSGREVFDIELPRSLAPSQLIWVSYRSDQGHSGRFQVRSRLDTAVEVDYYRQGGILPAVLRQLVA